MLRIPRFQLYRMGSDPEFLFAKKADLDFIITPACTILGKDKAKTTASFIGTDSRPVIAEIRPTPSRNLKRHMYDLAYAVVKAQSYVDERHKGHVMLASPSYLNETLGGHIHVSGFLDEPMYLDMARIGYTIGNSGQFAQAPGLVTQVFPDALQRQVMTDMQSGELLTPFEWGQVLNWLLAPFEFWFQPWVQREHRNKTYGGPLHPDVVRIGTSSPPFSRAGMAYVHWEYRLPSTWLLHPYMAMAYLSLVKLVMLNFKTVAREYAEGAKAKRRKGGGFIVPDEAPQPANPDLYNFHPVKEAENEQHYQVFAERLSTLQRSRPIITPDISDVFRMVAVCGENREKWFSPARPVMVEEWRKLL